MEKLMDLEILQLITDKVPLDFITEIRLRMNKKILIKTKDKEFFIDKIATDNIIKNIVLVATNYSQYAYEKEMSDGYIPYKGGIRIGIGGNGRLNRDKNIIAYKQIYSLNIRIPHQIFGCCQNISAIMQDFDSTLVISPPYGGKTTLIREMARLLSIDFDVLVIDERYEICGENCILKMGERCDIIQGLCKEYVFENIIRTMSPQIIVCDELFGENEYLLVERIVASGIKCLATFHANNMQNLPDLLKKVFVNIITLHSKPSVGSISSIYRG